MDDQTKKYLIIAAGAIAAGYLGYTYLNKTGHWQKWFGGSSAAFTDREQLLVYCAANPQGMATFEDSTGTQTTLPCATWLQYPEPIPGLQGPFNPHGLFSIELRPVSPAAAIAAAQNAPGAPQTQTDTPLVDQTLLGALRTAAKNHPALRSDRASVHQWNLLLATVDPAAIATDLSQVGIQYGVNDVMDAQTFLELRNKSGFGNMRGVGNVSAEFVDEPYAWVN